MNIGFIGAGKVGCTLGRYFVMHGIGVNGFYDLDTSAADYAAKLTETKSYDNMGSIVLDSDMIFITVTDSAIGEVFEELKSYDISGRFICHCSGSLTSAIFSDIDGCNAFGYSVHPLFACSSKEHSYKDIQKAIFTIEGSSKHISDVKNLIEGLGNKVQVIDAGCKSVYHAAAVVASNQVVALVNMAVNMLKLCGFEHEDAFSALMPLIAGNVDNMRKQGIEDALTGPVERNDVITVTKHMKAMTGDMLEIYRLLSKQLVSIAKLKNPDRNYRELERLLDEEIKEPENKIGSSLDE